jgi:NADH-quinone oxidoreductase subunit G
MCDEGRFGWKYIHDQLRLAFPEQRVDGKVVAKHWEPIQAAIRSAFTSAAQKSSSGVAAVFSPWMTVEEAYLLASWITSISRQATLALGPVRVVGEDDTYPKDVHGRPATPVKFTIRAEKCPNRRGVEAVLQHFTGSVANLGDVLGRAADGNLGALYLVGGDPAGWIDESQAAALTKTTTVVQDILPSPASEQATFLLPGGSFAERDGTFINHAGLAQQIRRSIRGPGEARPDGRILWDLAGRKGLFRAATVRAEIAAAIPSLAALATDLGTTGVRVVEG